MERNLVLRLARYLLYLNQISRIRSQNTESSAEGIWVSVKEIQGVIGISEADVRAHCEHLCKRQLMRRDGENYRFFADPKSLENLLEP